MIRVLRDRFLYHSIGDAAGLEVPGSDVDRVAFAPGDADTGGGARLLLRERGRGEDTLATRLHKPTLGDILMPNFLVALAAVFFIVNGEEDHPVGYVGQADLRKRGVWSQTPPRP